MFVEWRWDGERLEIRNDRYGVYPLYYFAKDNEICVSTSIARLLDQGAPRDLNDAGIAVFLRLGFFLAEDTPFRHIHSLPPAAQLVWTQGKLEVTGARHIPKPQHLSRQQAIDGYIDLFRAAICRRAPTGTFAVPLSGGRDSRHIAFEIHRKGWRPHAFVTLDPMNSDEAGVAKQIAEQLKVPQHIVAPTMPSIAVERQKNIHTDYCSDEHRWLLGLTDYLNRNYSCIYDGIAGDVLSAGLFLDREAHDLFESGCLDKIAALKLKPTERFLSRVLREDMFRTWSYEIAAERMRGELERYSHAANPVGAFYFWNRTRREISLYSYGLLRNVKTVFAPYLDHELFDLLASLPASLMMDHQFHSDVIRIAYPEFAGIPYAGPKRRTEQYGMRLRNFAIEMMQAVVHEPGRQYFRKWYSMGHLLAAVLSPRHRFNTQWLAPMVVYLLQLRRLASHPG